MATETRAELDAAFDYLGEGGLDDFEPEAPRGGTWLRAADPSPADAQRWEPFAAPRPAPRSWPVVVPVVAAAAIAGAVMSWAGMGASQRTAAPAPLRFADPPPIREPVTPAVAPVDMSPARAPSPAVASPATPSPVDPVLQETLASVAQAYRALDASSLAAVWPAVDTARLADTFSGLKYQSLAVDRCQTRTNGADGAVASCDVSIAAAPKDGDPGLQRRRESWTLVRGRDGGRWTIAGVTVRGSSER